MNLVKTVQRFISSSSVNLKYRRLIRIKPFKYNFADFSPQDVQWDELRQNLITDELSVNKTNVDGIIIGMCTREKRLDLAKSYLKFIESSNLQLSDAALGKYLKFRYNAYILSESRELAGEEQTELVKMCDHIISKNNELHPEIAESVICGLCMTMDWRKSLELIKRIGKIERSSNDESDVTTATGSFHSAIILRSIREKDLNTTWRLIDENIENNFVPSTQIFIEFLKQFVDKKEEIERLLKIIGEQSLLMPHNSIDVIKETLSKNYRTDIMTVKNDGICWTCLGELRSINLNETEFKKLCSNFMNDVFKRKDIFFQTTPRELESFKNFVEKAQPFDCVVDGLNVAYSHGQTKDTRLLAGNIASVVKYLKARKQKVLVVGRQHMVRWPKNHMDYIRKNSSLFLAQNISHDDPFTLYAALRSGPNTNIFSRDLMRNHSFHLDNESKKLFRRWQQQHQMKLVTTLTKDEILVQHPISFDLKAHKVGDCWHIPFTDENHRFSHETFSVPVQWICVEIR